MPKAPEGITEKQYENFVSRITWTPCEGADYYKVLAVEIVDRNARGNDEADGDEAAGGTATEGGAAVGEGAVKGGSEAVGSSTASAIYEPVGEFEIAGYTTVCDFANMDAKADKHYAYKVTAVNAAGESPESEIFAFGLQLAVRDESESDDSGTPEPEGSEPSEQQPEQDEAQSASTVVIIVVVLALAAAAVVTGVLVWKRSRKQ